jgi:hypothetical protein
LTASGVLPRAKCATADNGTIVSLKVLTAAPVEVPPRPVLASALIASLRAVFAVDPADRVRHSCQLRETQFAFPSPARPIDWRNAYWWLSPAANETCCIEPWIDQ